ncbi:MAG: imidazole glycerol phosphate synthase subunit HisH [Chloroflexaceae bacterium]|nr:imidazole glycerol phosphate synthase subunit HisH [Chloroflexaceae bacterium]NJO05806.1 imidazole glycerol phosphate synthase subunit HisH [Chloroflexaceae bacterium]
MFAVINYGAGNLPNAVRALQHVGADLTITSDPADVLAADAVVLPGVGATRDTMQSLDKLGISAVLPQVVARGTPFLGICVGMQVLCSRSNEFGSHPCLDIVPGVVQRLPGGQKVPQIGWNQVCYSTDAAAHPLFAGIPNGSDFYFVHSYYCNVSDPTHVAATTDYGLAFPSIVIQDNLYAVQFHPEKSGHWGLRLLQNFVQVCARADMVRAG